mmetsp:Transcript_24613/g.58122  ORF Transcript_24613/g.58122 Transcript_24613/m.58122 type:complete len:330 (+) Transcript_24613:3-992(+)
MKIHNPGRPLHVVMFSPNFRVDWANAILFDWITDVLLVKVPRRLVVHTESCLPRPCDISTITVRDDSLFLINYNNTDIFDLDANVSPVELVADQIEARGRRNVGVIYTNENQFFLIQPNFTRWSYAFRMHLHDHVGSDVKYLPLGRTSYTPLRREWREIAQQRASVRSFLCAFAGTLPKAGASASDRAKLRDTLLEIIHSKDFDPNCALFGNNARTGDEYFKVMMDTAFTLCPLGVNPETFRFYEALDHGSVPIVIRPTTKVNYLDALGNPPVIVLDDWSQLRQVLKEYEHPKLQDERQAMVMNWWKWKREEVGWETARTIEESFAATA